MMCRRYRHFPAVHVILLALCIVAASSFEKSRAVSRPIVSWRRIFLWRGGAEETECEDVLHNAAHATEPEQDAASAENNNDEATKEPLAPKLTHKLPQRRKVRHASDVIVNLKEKHGQDRESRELRSLIASRAQSFTEDLSQSTGTKLPHPRRVLHFVAPKIPAIKHSPDVMLRVQSSRGSIDAGVAACAIGTIARLCELYDRQSLRDNDDLDTSSSVGNDIVKDRRFQQLVECVLCGVDLQKSTQEAKRMKDDGEVDDGIESRDIEEVLDEENVEIDAGLSVQDACRAAWGIALLGGSHTESFGEVATSDILTALSLRSRELLLARLQLLRQGVSQKRAGDVASTLVERLDQDAEELAEDTASVMWIFACVRALTGVRSVPLFEACCSILCQNPADLRERAQAKKEGLEASNFEANDILERLAQSEEDGSLNETASQANKAVALGAVASSTEELDVSDTTKDSLLDWLSPNEVTDVVWALALHGSRSDTDSKEETALSETAAAFREIAFDRLVDWLRCDTDVIDQVKRDSIKSSLVPETIGTDGVFWFDNSDSTASSRSGEMAVEVVDAATLLASSATLETEVVKTVDSISVNDDPEHVNIKQVEVVDAATILALTPENIHVQAETEVLLASKTAPAHETSATRTESSESIVEAPEGSEKDVPDPALPVDSQRENGDAFLRMSSLLNSGRLSFSPRDLCSIAWAVTDLRDPLKYLIVDLITHMFESLGRESMAALEVGDLSNLAWAIARSSGQQNAMSWANYAETSSALVTRWTVESVLSRLDLDGNTVVAVRSMLEEFQPPELGRLLWSLASTVTNHVDPFELENTRDSGASRLASLAMITAGMNLSIFGTEDLTRITWAFLELCDANEVLSRPRLAESLGLCLSVLESALMMWENGPRIKSSQPDFGGRVGDGFHHSTSFFGRRFPLLMLNQRIAEHVDEDEEQPTHQADRKLPLLRDLPVDPSSLCKLTSGYYALSECQHNTIGGWTFLRVAVRLLESKNGQLMEQCPFRDVVRLCHACATVRTNGKGQAEVCRLFARRVVRFMNEALDPDHEANGKAAARLAGASPWEISILMWSLGELGACHVTTDESRQQAYRKLRLVADQPLLTKNQVQSLSPASTANLLRGIVSMNMIASDPAFVSTVLNALQPKVERLQSGKELTCLADSIAQLRRFLPAVNPSSPEERSNEPIENEEPPKVTEETEAYGKEEESGSVVESEHDLATVTEAIRESTNRVLAGVAVKAVAMLPALSAVEMKKLLLVYLAVPFEADALVDAIAAETDRRLSVLELADNRGRIQDVAELATESALQANGSLSAKTEQASPLNAIKNGIKGLFGVHDFNDEVLEETAERLAEVAESLHRTAILSSYTSDRIEKLEKGTGTDAETLFRGAEQGAAVELGRCRELIACYRRIETHGGRYDSERRKDIGKRVLSRLFP